MERYVTLEVLKRSQRSRPRKWIPVMSFFLLLVSLAAGLYYMFLALQGNPFSDFLRANLPPFQLKLADTVLSIYESSVIFLFPLIIYTLNIVFWTFTSIFCSYRKVYWSFCWLFVLIGAVDAIAYTYVMCYTTLEWVRTLSGNLPPMVLEIIFQVFTYVTFGLPLLYALFFLFCLFYNVNYPARYERIYTLRKRRLKGLALYDERVAYKKRFYNDYKYGRWNSMMLDLFYEELKPGSNAPIPKDAYAFLISYTGACDGEVKGAIFNEYASQGRYKECRDAFQKAMDKQQSLQHGAKIVIPHYEEPKPKPKPKPAPAPKIQPPLETKSMRRKPNSRVRTWVPEDIG